MSEKDRWDEIMARHHYLGFRQLVGESLKYVAILDDQPVALLGWGSAAFKSRHRDRWIGWSPEIQWRRLKFIANNLRFLILPGAQVKNLASKILSVNIKRLSQDWYAVYGHHIMLAETFIDPTRFRGTCYLAAGWLPLGRSRGFSRNGGRYYFHGHPKTIFVRPLCKNARHLLAAPFLSPQLKTQSQEVTMDLNSLRIEGKGGLFDRLAQISDPRKPRGIRHSQMSILAIAICACLSGCRSFAAIGQWAANLTQELRERLCCRKDDRTGKYIAPSEPTIRRVLQKVDAEEVDQMISQWLADRNGQAIAVDGKTLRGSGKDGEKAVHLLAALLHKEGVVIGQQEVDSKSNEITAFEPLLDGVDLKGKIVTADAMHAQVKHAEYVKERGGDYVLVVKKNQSTILEAIKDLDSDFFSSEYKDYDKGHGRIETRIIRCSTALNDYLDFPHCAQVCQIERITTDLNGEKTRTETAYGITSLSPEKATPERLLNLVRGHWSIENRLHWVRDVTFDEDRSQVRTGFGPRVMASLRNLAISLFRICGSLNIAESLRYCSWNPDRALVLLGL